MAVKPGKTALALHSTRNEKGKGSRNPHEACGTYVGTYVGSSSGESKLLKSYE